MSSLVRTVVTVMSKVRVLWTKELSQNNVQLNVSRHGKVHTSTYVSMYLFSLECLQCVFVHV